MKREKNSRYATLLGLVKPHPPSSQLFSENIATSTPSGSSALSRTWDERAAVLASHEAYESEAPKLKGRRIVRENVTVASWCFKRKGIAHGAPPSLVPEDP